MADSQVLAFLLFKIQTSMNRLFIPFKCLILFFTLIHFSCNSSYKASENSNDRAWKMGVASWSFHKYPFITALDKADSTGVRYMEISAGFEMGKEFNDSAFVLLSASGIQIAKQLLDKKGLKMVSTYADGHSINEWIRNFEFAKTLGLTYITGEPSMALLAGIDSLAAIYNIPVALHNHWKGLSVYWNPDTVLSIARKYKHIKACADIGHWARSGLDPAESMKKLEGNILGVHLKDIGEFGNIHAEDRVPGSGVINFNEVVKELKRQQFQGMIYVECELNWYNNVPDIIKSLDFFSAAGKE